MSARDCLADSGVQRPLGNHALDLVTAPQYCNMSLITEHIESLAQQEELSD